MVVLNGSKFLVLLIEKENTAVFIWFYRYFLFYRTNIRNCRLDRLSFSGGKEIMVVYVLKKPYASAVLEVHFDGALRNNLSEGQVQALETSETSKGI